MFRRKTGGVSAAETATRTVQAVGRTVAGERGGKAANRVTSALGLGRIEHCNKPDCPDCN
ncbi:hypothetical protein OG402_33925 [Streptomyces anulatus]|uniref:hypothetical protein n=1 Tax=Streptomyces anulatus TaxID=1892 RepID=UPI002253A9DC|nr:hypothetical protein [Streptomyces anulatus]MCX4605468.1 hypothetical protein [Streptomyces anulatus]